MYLPDKESRSCYLQDNMTQRGTRYRENHRWASRMSRLHNKQNQLGSGWWKQTALLCCSNNPRHMAHIEQCYSMKADQNKCQWDREIAKMTRCSRGKQIQQCNLPDSPCYEHKIY